MIWPFPRRPVHTVNTSASGIEARFALTQGDFSLDVNLQLPGRGVSALFGDSGAGKTSCLRCMAGLDRAEGYLRVNGELWQDSQQGFFLPPHRRAVGYVFQDANLFAHLSVRGNLQYGLKRVAPEQRRINWDQAVALLGIGRLLERMPATLSGGERQRVAIARALLSSPRLLLLDEPLAALDLKRKQEVLPYLERLQHELDIPLLYVSHSPDEVARLADHLVLLQDGRALASGPLKQTLLRADLPFIQQDDAEAVVDGQVCGYDSQYALLRLQLPGSQQELRLPHDELPLGKSVRVKIKARDVSLSLQQPEHSSVLNLLAAQVLGEPLAQQQAHVLLRLQVGSEQMLVRITRYSYARLGIEPGQQLWAQVKAVSLLTTA